MNFDGLDWFKGRLTGKHQFCHQIWEFPVNSPLKQSNECLIENCPPIKSLNKFVLSCFKVLKTAKTWEREGTICERFGPRSIVKQCFKKQTLGHLPSPLESMLSIMGGTVKHEMRTTKWHISHHSIFVV